jgi:argininosuccinate lyase
MTLVTNNLPSGYHREFQLLKEPIMNAISEMNDIIDITTYAISQVQVHTIDMQQEQYQYLFTVDSINALVQDGMSFREAYQVIGEQVQNGTYKPTDIKKHTHIGSMHNLHLDDIKKKFPTS